VRMTEPQPAKETLLSVSEVDNQLYSVRNQMEALQRQMNALIAKEVELEALRDKVATEAAKVKLATPEPIE